MKILMASYVFAPGVGGIEKMGALLARTFLQLGHEVRVVTAAEDEGATCHFPFPVIRRPGMVALLKETRWCDIYFHNNISLNYAWPLLAIRRPWVVAHHTWVARPDGRLCWKDRIKLQLTRHASNIAVSQPMARQLPVPATVIYNAYNADAFKSVSGVKRDRELVFVGRLVTDKGADLLLEAMAFLSRQGLRPALTIIGDGPERPKLEILAEKLDLKNQVCFQGVQSESELARTLNAHCILVVPSRWQEPFGLTALEGIACGCVVIGSEGGGLRDAIGPCGTTFPNGNVQALADVLQRWLLHPDEWANYKAQAARHLEPHQPVPVASQYLQVFQRALANWGRDSRRTSTVPQS